MLHNKSSFPPILGQRVSRSIVCGALFFGGSLFLCIYERDIRFAAGFAVSVYMFWSVYSCVHDFWNGKIKSFNAELVVSKASFKSTNLVFKETLEDGEELFREYYYAKQKELPATDVKYTCYYHANNPNVLLGFELYDPLIFNKNEEDSSETEDNPKTENEFKPEDN